MKGIGLVSCTKSKAGHAMPAKNLYLPSSLFRKARAYCERTYDDWYILSAKHGVLHPESVVEPYDVTLNNMSIDIRREWGKQVWSGLRTLLPCVFYFHTGARYRDTVIPYFRESRVQFYIPLEGLRVGEQMSWYDRQPR